MGNKRNLQDSNQHRHILKKRKHQCSKSTSNLSPPPHGTPDPPRLSFPQDYTPDPPMPHDGTSGLRQCPALACCTAVEMVSSATPGGTTPGGTTPGGTTPGGTTPGGTTPGGTTTGGTTPGGTIQSQQPCARFTAESPTHVYTSAYTPDNIVILPVPLYHESDNEEMVSSATPGDTTQPSAQFTADSPTHAYTPDNIAILPVPLYHVSDNEAPTQNPFSPFPPNI